MRFIFVYCILIMFTLKGFAQTKPVLGFVVDQDNKQRLAKVYIYNPKRDLAIFNNTKGEFSIDAKVGDTIFAALSGYAMDTAIYRGQGAIVFQLKSLGIKLKEVKVYGKLPSAQEAYEKNLRDYKYKLDRGSSKDLISLGPQGAGLGIDAIYNLLSREGKNARRLQGILEKDYHEQIIDFRYRHDYVKTVVKIKAEDLKDFMSQYRPTYNFVLTANDYEFVAFIKNSFATYQRNPAMLRLPKLQKTNPQPDKE